MKEICIKLRCDNFVVIVNNINLPVVCNLGHLRNVCYPLLCKVAEPTDCMTMTLMMNCPTMDERENFVVTMSWNKYPMDQGGGSLRSCRKLLNNLPWIMLPYHSSSSRSCNDLHGWQGLQNTLDWSSRIFWQLVC